MGEAGLAHSKQLDDFNEIVRYSVQGAPMMTAAAIMPATTPKEGQGLRGPEVQIKKWATDANKDVQETFSEEVNKTVLMPEVFAR